MLILSRVHNCVIRWSDLSQKHPGGKGNSKYRAYGYVPPTTVDFSLPKMQNRSRILNFFPEQALIFKVLLQNRILSSITLSQMSKMPVAFLKYYRSNLNFLSEKYTCLLAKDTECVPVTIIISKLYSNKLMLPVGLLILASCSVMLTNSCKNEHHFIRVYHVLNHVIFWQHFERCSSHHQASVKVEK